MSERRQLPEITTSRTLGILTIVLSLLLIVAAWWRPVDDLGNRTRLIWVSDNNPTRTEQINTFNQENPQYKLVLDPGNQSIQKVLLQCSSGVGPDIFDIYGTSELQTYVEAGVLSDITTDAGKGGFSSSTSWPGMAGLVTYAGRQYSYPCNIGTAILVFNKNVFDYYGVPYPTKIETWDDLIQLGLKVSSVGTGKTGLDGPIYGIARLGWQYFFASQHGEYFDSAGRLNILNNAALRKAFEYHRDLVFKHKLTPTSIELQAMGGQGGWGAADFNQFTANKFAMIVTGNYALISFGRTHEEQMKELETTGRKAEDLTNPLEKPLRLGTVLLPGFADQPTCYAMDSRSAGINAFSPHRRQALAFLQYLASPAYSALVNGGKDNLPGNSKYADLGASTEPDDLDTAHMHQVSVQAMAFGYSMRKSPFILTGEVDQVLTGEISRLESDSSLSLDLLFQDAQRQLSRLLQRNLDHDPALKKLAGQT